MGARGVPPAGNASFLDRQCVVRSDVGRMSAAGGGLGPERNGYHRLDSVQEPEDRTGKARTYAWVSVHDLREIFKRNLWKFHNLRTAEVVLQNPHRVFKHIRTGQVRPGWCYSKQVDRIWSADGTGTVRSRQGLVFSVYLNADLAVFEWGSDECEPSDPRSPRGASNGMGTPTGRFGELVWRANP